VRSARRPGRLKRFKKTVSVSAAATIACFQFACTGDSAADTMREPICTPSAPSANAAAMLGPSQMPPAAITGTSTFEQTSGNNTMVATSSGFLKPPPSPPSTTRPSTPAATAFSAADKDGTTWNTVSPASFNCLVYWRGSPAEVVTKRTPCATTKSTIAGSRTNICAMLTPNGWSVRSRILRISSRTLSSSPDDVSMMPSPPALETADASWARAIHPIGACTIG